MFTTYLEMHNVDYYVIKDTKKPSLGDAHSVSVDFSDKATLYHAVDALPQKPVCVLSMYEQYLPVAADVNEYLGIAHALSPEAARRSTDKVLMREAFATAPEPISPPFALVETEVQAQAFAEIYGFPLMLKPANLSKSLLISRCDTTPGLLRAWRQAIAAAPALYARQTDGLRPRFILEVFMPGSVHTAMAFVDKQGTISFANELVDNVTARDAGFDDSFIFSRTIPSQLALAKQRALLRCAELGVKALGLRSCAAHIELIQTASGPRLIEIGARVGGYRTVMYDKASGIDVIGAVLAAYAGNLPDLTAQKHAFYRAIEIFPKHRGRFAEITNFAAAEKLPSILRAHIKCRPGETIGKATEGYKAAAVFELYNENEKQIEADYSFIRNEVRAIAVSTN